MDLDPGKMLLKEDIAGINRKVMPAAVVMGNATGSVKAAAAATDNLINKFSLKLVGNRMNKKKGLRKDSKALFLLWRGRRDSN